MNFTFAEKLNPFLQNFDFSQAIELAEKQLTDIPETDFHDIIGKSLTHHANDFAEWIEEFYEKSCEGNTITCLYFELNEFDLNTDCWYIDAFAYNEDGGMNLDNMEWLSNYQTDSDSLIDSSFIFEDYETLQEAFESVEGLEEEGEFTDEMNDAKDWCEQIIIARFMELIRASHILAKETEMSWANCTVYCTEHAYDFIIQTRV